MEFIKKCVRLLRPIFGEFLIALGGIAGVSSAVCAFVMLFGGMGIDSFGERLILFATVLVMAVGFFTILWLGIRLKDSGCRDIASASEKRESAAASEKRESAAAPEKRESAPAKKKIKQDVQECSDFMRKTKVMIVLESEYDKSCHSIQVDKTTGQPYEVWSKVIGHSGSSFASTTVEVFEKPVRRISYGEMISLAEETYSGIGQKYEGINETNWQEYADVWLKFTDAEKKRSLLLTLEHNWGGRAEHSEQKLTLMHQDDIYCLNLVSREWNDAGGCSTLQENSTKCVAKLKVTERHRWTVSGFLFHAKTLRGLPVWAAEKLAQEKVFTELFTPPYGNCEEEAGQVYWSNLRDPMEYSCIWFEKQDGMWHAHSDVRMGGIRIKKDTPLPDATDKNIARCLELDSMIYLYHPDIENWIRRDRCGEVTLYHQIEEKGSTDERHIIYTIDPRNGALYYYEGLPWNRAASEEAHTATYAELAQADSRYTGMTIQNWEEYLPKKVNSDQNGRQSQRLSKSMDLPKKMADNLREITVQAAWNTFPPEQQEKFSEQLYQYSQDVGRDGYLSEEVYAANRGLVFMDRRPVPKEVAQRLDEMRQAAISSASAALQKQEEAVLVLYDRHWAGKAENGEDKIFLKAFEYECVITYECRSRNCYATPPIEDVRTKEQHCPLAGISTWSLEELLQYINQTFHLSINVCDCCSEEQYLAWIENHNTEFYSMEIMFDGKKQVCMFRLGDEKSCEEVRFQGQTYFWKILESTHGLRNFDYAAKVCLNEKVYYLYYTEVPNKNTTLYWIVSQITESVFELLKHQPCNHEEIVFEKEIGKFPTIVIRYAVLALETGRTFGYDDDESVYFYSQQPMKTIGD